MNQQVKPAPPFERKLAQALLLTRRRDDDRLALADAVLLDAIAGRRPLRRAESAALLGSALTMRRFRLLAQQYGRQHGQPDVQPEVQPEVQPQVQPDVQPQVQPELQPHVQPNAQVAGQDGAVRRQLHWQGSSGMLRAAADAAPLTLLETDDGHFALHFIAGAGGSGWQVVLRLDPGAPFAAALLGAGAVLEVRDGAGAVLLQGSLDGDGECEQAWPFAAAPAPHFQRHGARFAVAMAAPP